MWNVSALRVHTQHVELVSVFDCPVFVLHHARVVPSVRWNGALHDQTPLLIPQLESEDERDREGFIHKVGHYIRGPLESFLRFFC